jgi:hypothetical protein
MLSAMWHIPSSLKAINTTIFVPHMAGIRPIVELRELERKIERAVSPYCMERITVDVTQNWNGGGQVWINIGCERGGMEEVIESVVKRFIDGCTAMEWDPNPINPERMATLTIQHKPKWWKGGEEEAFCEKLRAAIAGDPQRIIWEVECWMVETKVHIIKPEEYSIPPRCGKARNVAEAWCESARRTIAELGATPEANAPHTFFTKRLSMDEPRLIIRDELADWTREQRQKKTEEREMFAVNKIVAITEETKAIKLVVHKGETQKEMTMTAQATAQHQNDTVWKVDVAGDVLVLHVGYVKD